MRALHASVHCTCVYSNFCLFCIKAYLVGTHWNSLNEAISIDTHKICFEAIPVSTHKMSSGTSKQILSLEYTCILNGSESSMWLSGECS